MFVVGSATVGRGISREEIGSFIWLGVAIEASLLGRHGIARNSTKLLVNLASSCIVGRHRHGDRSVSAKALEILGWNHANKAKVGQGREEGGAQFRAVQCESDIGKMGSGGQGLSRAKEAGDIYIPICLGPDHGPK